MTPADLVLLTANAVFGTSYVAVRLTSRTWARHALLPPSGPRVADPRPRSASRGAAPAGGARVSRADRWALFWMGFVGFTLAMATSHWGLFWSTATNGALLLAVEPVTMVALSPLAARRAV